MRSNIYLEETLHAQHARIPTSQPHLDRAKPVEPMGFEEAAPRQKLRMLYTGERINPVRPNVNVTFPAQRSSTLLAHNKAAESTTWDVPSTSVSPGIQRHVASMHHCESSRTSPSHLLLYRVVFSIPIRHNLAQPLCANCKADLPTSKADMTSSRLLKAAMTSIHQCQENFNRPSQLRRSVVIPPRRKPKRREIGLHLAMKIKPVRFPYAL